MNLSEYFILRRFTMGVLVIVIPVLLLACAFGQVTHGYVQCGKMVLPDPKPTPMIIGGDKAAYGEFPWLATLRYNKISNGVDAGMRCAGFVINKRFVITAAHCLVFDDYNLTSVYLGVRQISLIESSDVDKVRKFEVEKFIPHEQYSPFSYVNNIALLKLKTEIIYTDYIRPICLPNADAALPPNGTLLWVAGWGQEGLNSSTGSDIKLKVEVPIYSYEECEEKLNRTIRSDQFCAEGELLKGTCWGDEGAPLMYPVADGVNRSWTAMGIVSYGRNKVCGTRGVFLVHTRVSSYINWINQNVETL